MEKITLADGTELEDSHVLNMNGSLSFYVRNGMGLDGVYALMSDRTKTETITALRFATETEYEGYTHLEMIQQRGSQVSGVLTKENA